jgi:hypothetical protein
MYEREDIWKLIRMMEGGTLKLASEAGWVTARKFKLEQWSEAFARAAQHAGPGGRVFFDLQ